MTAGATAPRKALQAALRKTEKALGTQPVPLEAPPSPAAGRAALAALAKTARDMSAAPDPTKDKPLLRCIHHLACTGGTLLSRMVAAQPNVTLLSEIDPLSPIAHPHRFVPTDMVGLAKFGTRPASAELQLRVFLAGLAPLVEDSAEQGLYMVLRDHSHGKYTHGPEVASRPSLREILARDYALRSVVTVRDPVDSYLALQHNKWINFTPATFDEYCRRVGVFLDDHADLEVLRYEDFVSDPAGFGARLCKLLALPFNPEFSQLMPALKISGDSGRSGVRIRPRPRRPIPEALRAEILASEAYTALAKRLGYTPLSEEAPGAGKPAGKSPGKTPDKGSDQPSKPAPGSSGASAAGKDAGGKGTGPSSKPSRG